jgi:chromosome segregation ATPase
VIKKFFISLVSHTRSLFYKANQDADNWLKEVMTPLVKQIKEHKTSMERRLETLRRISDSRDTLDARIEELNTNLCENKKQLNTLQQIQHAINTPLPGTSAETPDTADQLEAMV